MTTIDDPGRRRELLRALLRGRAWQALEGNEQGPLIPAVPAALALRRATDGSGDVFSARVGSPVAALTFGITAEDLLRQARGLATARASGRDPGGFPSDPALGLIAPVSSPGTLVGVLAGVALAFALRGEDRVALLVDDADGTASGFWHEGLNLAAAREAPFVLVVDSARRRPMTARVERISARAAAYGIEGTTVEGSDPGAVLDTITAEVDRARAGGGTRLVEVVGPPADSGDNDPLADFIGRLQWAEVVIPTEARDWAEQSRIEMDDARVRVAGEPTAGQDHALPPLYSTSPERSRDAGTPTP